jgi:hypothetical protein
MRELVAASAHHLLETQQTRLVVCGAEADLNALSVVGVEAEQIRAAGKELLDLDDARFVDDAELRHEVDAAAEELFRAVLVWEVALGEDVPGEDAVASVFDCGEFVVAGHVYVCKFFFEKKITNFFVCFVEDFFLNFVISFSTKNICSMFIFPIQKTRK